MPFTPFHMGAALIAKPGLNRNISVITFGIAQIAMDIEPGVGMLTGADVLHGPTHTILGALVIAYLVTLIAPGICNYLLKMWNREVTHHKLSWLVQPETSKTAMTVGARWCDPRPQRVCRRIRVVEVHGRRWLSLAEGADPATQSGSRCG